MMTRSLTKAAAAALPLAFLAGGASRNPAVAVSSMDCKCTNAMDCNCGTKVYTPKNERIYDSTRRSFLPAAASQRLSRELAGRKIVTVGEVHSNLCHHHCEFEVVRALANNADGDMAIGLECFYRQHQAALDRYILEHGDIGVLKKETSWDTNWGYDLNYYAKIFNFAKQRGIRLIGLNLPYPVARFVAENGIKAVPADLKVLLPQIDMSNAAHRAQFNRLIGVGHGDEPIQSIERMYQVQCLWDDYMSESAAQYIEKHPKSVVCVIAGLGHIMGRSGIPDRIARRTKATPFVIVPQQVGWSSDTGLPDIDTPLGKDACDWCWYTEGADV